MMPTTLFALSLLLSVHGVVASESCSKDSSLTYSFLQEGQQVHRHADAGGKRVFSLKFPLKQSDVSLLMTGGWPSFNWSSMFKLWWGKNLAAAIAAANTNTVNNAETDFEAEDAYVGDVTTDNKHGPTGGRSLIEEDVDEQFYPEHECEARCEDTDSGTPYKCLDMSNLGVVEGDVWACEGKCPSQGIAALANCEKVNPELLESGTVIFAKTSELEEASQKLAVAQIAKVAKRAGANTKIVVDGSIHSAVSEALEGHEAKKQIAVKQNPDSWAKGGVLMHQ